MSAINLIILISLIFLHIDSFAQNGAGNGLMISTPEEIKTEFDSVPCKNTERLNAVKALFEKMGAGADEIKVDDFKIVKNVTIHKPGFESDAANEKIVIGAHYDKTEDGCGAIDNWSGIVALAHIYRSLKNVSLKTSIVFVAFGREEKGLVGSSAMVNGIKKERAAEYCAMINIDSLGLSAPQVADNMSTKKLLDLTANLAAEMKVPFAHANIPRADSDSSSFIKKKIPALTIHGMSSDWPKLLHSRNDQAAKVNPDGVYLGYRLALALLVRISESDCQSFRDK